MSRAWALVLKLPSLRQQVGGWVGGCACARVCECLYSTRVSVSWVLASAVEYEATIDVDKNVQKIVF